MSGLVVVSPHLDDAVLSAWLVLVQNPDSTVVTCFSGVPAEGVRGSWDERSGMGAASAAVAARRREDEAALAFAPARPVHLDLLDVQYRIAAAPPPLDELVEALRPELTDAEEVWLPAGIGGHADHLLAGAAARAALRPAQRAHVYADLPYAGQPGWPVAISGGPRDRMVDAVLAGRGIHPETAWRQALASLPVGPVQIRPLSRHQRTAKLRALGCYGSQLDALRCGPGHPLRSRRLFRREVCWPLMPTS